MITLDNIPHLRVYRQKAHLPRDSKSPGMYSIIFSNNRHIDDTVSLMKHPLLITNSKYLAYYIEPVYREKIYTRTVNFNYRTKRQDLYNIIKNKFSLYKTPASFELLYNRNVYYDLEIFNHIFFNNTKLLSINRKTELYTEYIFNIINNIKFKSYKNKMIMIDIKSWLSGKDKINNPVTLIMLMCRKYFDKFKALGDINFYFYNDDMILRLNPSLCNNSNNIFTLKRELTKMTKSVNIDYEDDLYIDREIKKQEVRNSISSSITDRFGFIGNVEINDDGDEEITEDDDIIINTLNDKIEDKLQDIEPEEELSTEEIESKLKTNIDGDKELLGAIHDIIKDKKTGKTTASLQRDKQLREKQKEFKINNKKIDDYINSNNDTIDIPSMDVSNTVKTTNKNVTKIKFTNFEKVYNEKLMKEDTLKILTALNDKSIPVYIKDFKIEDSSDELTYKDTYRVVLEDTNRVRHSLTFDVPKFIEDKFLYINGSKKVISKQLTMKPIVKIKYNTVRVSSNYNIIRIERYGNSISPRVEKFKKALATGTPGMIIKYGDSSKTNMEYNTTIEYDEISKAFLDIKTSKADFIFNQKIIYDRLSDSDKKKLNINNICIGFYKDGKPIITDNNLKIEGLDIIDYIIKMAGTKMEEIYNNTNVTTKKYFYSRANIMDKMIPVVLLTSYCEGLSTVLKKANINHYFTDKRPKLDENQNYIQFKDGYLVYDIYPLENSILLNGLSIIPTKAFSLEDMDNKDTYIDLFGAMYNARNLSNAFDSFYEFMIDPITKEVLESLDYPTDFVSVLIFANSLLSDNSYIFETDMSLYRIRSNEIVNAIIHRELADAYASYRSTSASKNPTKISIPKDAIIKKLLTVNTIEEFSTLNPIYESDKVRSVSTKGLNGLNVEQAYTLDKRFYNDTMLGIIGMSTSPDANVGIVRKLVQEPNVINPRGFIDIKTDDDPSLKDVNLFTPGELLTPFGNIHDDSTRLAMAVKQSGHIIPVKKSSPVLISNGLEQTIQYSLSSDFIIAAEDDGEIVELDEDTGIMIVKYKNGNVRAVDINPRVLKNSSSGFYVSNKLNTDLKVKDKVKKNDIIAYEKNFFTNDGHNGNRFNIGSLQKLAIMSTYATYEDSTFVTNKLATDMESDIVMMKDVTIGKNANVDHIVNIGDTVHVGDLLVSFETSYDDSSLNKFLASVGDDLKEEIKSLGKVPIKSKYSGVIEDIKVYSSVDLKDLSPSLQKIVKKYYDKINKKKKIISKYDNDPGIIKAGLLMNEPTGKITPSSDGKIKGKEVFEGVLIEFYIKYRDVIGIGDKITYYSALKSIVGEVIDEGYEPFSEYRPDEEISTFLAPASILGRMTPSVIFAMFGNKVLVELKSKLKEIYEK